MTETTPLCFIDTETTGVHPDRRVWEVAIICRDAVGWLNARAAAEETFAKEVFTPPWKSDDLSRDCGVEPPSDADRHTALGDARWAMRWYDAMTKGAK